MDSLGHSARKLPNHHAMMNLDCGRLGSRGYKTPKQRNNSGWPLNKPTVKHEIIYPFLGPSGQEGTCIQVLMC